MKTTAIEDFNAVILKHHPYYVKDDCNSIDGIYGFDNSEEPRKCRECPNNVFGSAENGKKACKQGRKIYLQKEGESENTEIVIYDMNCVAFTKYVMKLLSKELRSSKVITIFKKTETSNGTQWQFLMLKELDEV